MRRKSSMGWWMPIGGLFVLYLLMVPLMVEAGGWGFGGHDDVGLSTKLPRILEQKNVEVLGWNDLQGRGTLQVTAKGNWLYVGHHNGQALNPMTGVVEWNGTTILDISNPKKPKIVVHIPNEENTNSRSASVVYNFGPLKKDYLVRNKETATFWGGEIFDITDRANPVLVKRFNIGPRGGTTNFFHKGWWSNETGRYYVAAGEPGYGRAYLMIFDLSDPSNPIPISDCMLPEQVGGTSNLTWHHPIVDEENNRVYGSYLTGGNVLACDIGNINLPEVVWHIDTSLPYRGTHNVIPIVYDKVPNFGEGALPRTYALVCDEGVGGDIQCTNPVRTKAYVFDITNAETTGEPFPVETWQVPDGKYCEKGGRFGPHQFAETKDGKINRFEDKLAYFAYFNAGMRVVDISDPYNLKEVGYVVPDAAPLSFPISTGQPIVHQANDVDLDYRGIAYVSDRVGGGLWVFKYDKHHPH